LDPSPFAKRRYELELNIQINTVIRLPPDHQAFETAKIRVFDAKTSHLFASSMTLEIDFCQSIKEALIYLLDWVRFRIEQPS